MRPHRGRPHVRLGEAGWRLRKSPKATWGCHSRPLFAKYRGDLGTPLPRGLSSLRGASSSERALPSLLRCAKRAPCAFTETAIKRAIRGAVAAGVTPGRLVVTREGFVIEFGAAATGGDSASGDTIATPRAAANLWDELLGVPTQQ